MPLKLLSVLVWGVLFLQCCAEQKIILTEAEERPHIAQFFYYVELILRENISNVTGTLEGVFGKIVDNVPEKDHGATTAILKDYIDALRRARNTGKYEAMEDVINQLRNVMENIKKKLSKQEVEDLIIAPNLIGLVFILSDVEQDEVELKTKFVKGALAMRQSFQPAGLQRHARFFNILTEIQANSDLDRQKKLMKQFHELKEEYD